MTKMTDSELLTAYGQHGNIAGLRNVASIAEQLAIQDHIRDAAKLIEPFGYFRPTIDGWEDCAKDDVGSRPLYENSLQAWHPIETAPPDSGEDGMFLLFEPHSRGGFIFVGCRNVTGGWINNLDMMDQNPTHWMPLPEPPK